MKKVLFGTTAIATAAFLSAGAQAATAPKLTISGYYNTAIVFGDDGNSDHTNVSFEDNDAKINFTIEGTADNGLTYGAVVKYRATNASSDRINDNYVYFSGAFGKFEFGSKKGVANNMTYQGPTPDDAGFIGVDTPSYWPQGGGTALSTVTTYNNLTGRSEKLNYYTPRIEGFQLGLTYTPHGCRVGAFGGSAACVASGGFESNTTDGNTHQDFEVAVNFSREFSGVTLGLSGNYAYQEHGAAGSKDRSAYGFGGKVAFAVGAGTLSAGAGYLKVDNKGFADHTDYQGFEGGIAYAQGPWQVGIESVYGDLGAADAGQGLPGHARTFAIGVGGGYQLAQGLTLSAGYMHYTYGVKDGSATTSAPDDANVFLIGTGISF